MLPTQGLTPFRTIICAAMNLVASFIGLNSYISGVVSGSPSVLSAVGAHMLIHLKEVGAKTVEGTTNNGMRTVSTIEFA